ncbi:TPA: hypothetical protein N0F65_002518 [Lagenidium giganteum]|uniref:Uncharacterized protein n=1 Tax=Lagenidium giganteum TaxID=4803 RepID=A0AAV2YVH4_9STRA|nr:TPA: hypothetical protein N0F65_002518 [Lagenidium giganteum]
MLRRKRRRIEAVVVEDSKQQEDADDAFPEVEDDVTVTIQLLISRNATSFEKIGITPVLLRHQLYAILPNRTATDQTVRHALSLTFKAAREANIRVQIQALKTSGQLLVFDASTGVRDVALVRQDDYMAHLKLTYDVLCKQQLVRAVSSHRGTRDADLDGKARAMSRFMPAAPHLASAPVVTMRLVLETFRRNACNEACHAKNECCDQCDDKAIREDVKYASTSWLSAMWLQRMGFLLPTSGLQDDALTFSFPGIGKFITAIRKARTAILAVIKRTQFKEIHEHQLRKMKLPHSVFSMDFHLADLEGIGLVRRSKVTSGTLVALGSM